MDRCYLANTSETAPEAPANSSGYPTAGSKVTGTPATVPGPYWFHAITEEIRNAIVKSGQTPDSSDLFQLYKSMMLIAHPVGSIYESTDSTDPGTLFGGTWEQIKDRVLVAAGDNFGAGTTGGNANHQLTIDEMPAHSHGGTTTSAGAHSHTRGSMEITGSFGNTDGQSYSWSGTADPYANGAFSQSNFSGRYRGTEAKGSGYARQVDFVASRTWSGATSANGSHTHGVTISSTGGGKAFSTMPPYIVIYVWKRVA